MNMLKPPVFNSVQETESLITSDSSLAMGESVIYVLYTDVHKHSCTYIICTHTHMHLAAATRTLVEWVVFRKSPLEVVASTLASSCMKYSMLSGGGTNRADQTETFM